MAILPGTRLGPYEVLSEIGAGGMGEVYRARDSKLGRDVAIKVLPVAFANDPERLARFQREAKMLAALNHPNIAAIYGLEHCDGVHFLIMELVSGETLAERVRTGAVPMDEALKIAVQIAEALEAAHEKNIIHRDLKPANIKVALEGKVKLLDFGLAKAFAGDAETSDPANSPTLTVAATKQGVIQGTAAYMSPEQARGKAVDKRTDIWAFGCVLYEVLTGKSAFDGEDVNEILGAVVKTEPDWNRLPANIPKSIHTLLRRCLQKDKALRMQAAGDARIEIHEALNTPLDSTRSTIAAVPRRTVLGWALFSGMVCLIVATIAGITGWNLKPAPVQRVTRTVIDLPQGQQLAGLESAPAVALSPDGTQLAYVARQAGTQQLYLRALDSLETRAIPGTEGAVEPFFSPDGQWLGFFASGKLKKVSMSGGAALALADAAAPNGAAWGSKGMIAFAPQGIESPLQRVSDAGGTPQLLTRIEKGEVHRWPEFLPSGNAVLFAAGRNGINLSNGQVTVQSVGTGERRDLIQEGMQPHYASSGHLIYAQGGNLTAVPFDPKRLAVTGAAVPVVEGVLQSPASGAAQYTLSSTGTLVYVSGPAQAIQHRLVWVNRNGAEQPVAAPAHAYFNLRLSPDGRLVCVDVREQGGQIWLYDLARETLTPLTFEGSQNTTPAWTPDGKRIAFQSNNEGSQVNLFWLLADGSGGLERLASSEYLQAPSSWSADGQLLAFTEYNTATGWDIWILHLSDRKAQPFLRTPFNEGAPRFSPDGRWLAYVSNQSGRNEIYVQAYPGPGGKYQISTEGGTEPVWNPKGRELFYRNGDKMMAVEVTREPSFSAGKPGMLFEGPYVPTSGTIPNYDVSADGQRFLMIKASERTSSSSLTQIVVVQNWFEELKRRVPTDK